MAVDSIGNHFIAQADPIQRIKHLWSDFRADQKGGWREDRAIESLSFGVNLE